jgi:TPP-dependent pyruvate/acetoin dehydrogenase alpha subunit
MVGDLAGACQKSARSEEDFFMIRYPAFDPPEYVNWKPDPDVVLEYNTRLKADPRRAEIIAQLQPPQLLALYEGMLRNRLHDITLKRWVKQGIASKAWMGTGEEAATIGAVHALDRGTQRDGARTDVVAPMIRNAGACHEFGMPVADMLRGYLGTADSPTKGRDLHIGDLGSGVLAPISPVGVMVPVAAGVALGFKMRREARVALTWIGDGSTKSGPFHEGINFAAALRLPLIVIIQNNQVALGTRLDQYNRGSFMDCTGAYGVEGWAFDGNNILDAYAAVKIAADRARRLETADRGPFLLVAETFRMGGHATHDEREARKTFPSELFDHWGKRDPIGLFETFLIEGDLNLETGARNSSAAFIESNTKLLRRSEQVILDEIERAAEEALQSQRSSMPAPESAAYGVFSDLGVERVSNAAGIPG